MTKNTKRKPRKRFKKISVKSMLPYLLGCMIVFLSGFLLYRHYKASYDSSEDGSELAEVTQQTVPADVEEAIANEKLSEGNTSQVLGTQATPFPIPKTVRVPILMYHYVEYVQDAGDTKRIALNTTPYTLDSEIKTLSDAGYTFMTNRELEQAMSGLFRLPKKPILLTFDDGYRDFYTDAYPILKKYHAKATQYVISGFLDRQNHLLTSQLQEIASDGLVEIGSHTVHHIWLKGESEEEVTTEVTESKKDLEKLIHRPVVSFAYPFGAFDEQARQAVIHAGYLSAVSTIPGDIQSDDNKFFMYRLRPGGRTGEDLLSFLDSIPTPTPSATNQPTKK